MLIMQISIPCKSRRSFFLTYETNFVLFLAMLEYSVLPMGWESSLVTLKSDVRTVNFRSDVINAPNDIRKWPLCDVKCHY